MSTEASEVPHEPRSESSQRGLCSPRRIPKNEYGSLGAPRGLLRGLCSPRHIPRNEHGSLGAPRTLCGGLRSPRRIPRNEHGSIRGAARTDKDMLCCPKTRCVARRPVVLSEDPLCCPKTGLMLIDCVVSIPPPARSEDLVWSEEDAARRRRRVVGFPQLTIDGRRLQRRPPHPPTSEGQWLPGWHWLIPCVESGPCSRTV